MVDLPWIGINTLDVNANRYQLVLPTAPGYLPMPIPLGLWFL